MYSFTFEHEGISWLCIHLQALVQHKTDLLQEHGIVLQPVLHPHARSSRQLSGIGPFIVNTGTSSPYLSSFQPKSGRVVHGRCTLIHTLHMVQCFTGGW